MMRIAVMSQYEAEQYCKLSHKEKSIMISISSTYFESPAVYATTDNGIFEILSLKFNDVESTSAKYQGITANQGYAISQFVRKYERTDTELLIVHCFAGGSRSAGVAAAIQEYFIGYASLLEDKRYNPTMLCYKIVKENLLK